jgi:hypothetical protein
MKPQTIGRVLGIGVRVVGRMAGQRLSESAQAGASVPGRGSPVQPVTIEGQIPGRAATRNSARTAGAATGSVARGVGGFLRPFRRVGNIVFLEVVGAFFFLFAVLFGNWAWRMRAQAVQGPEHSRFLVYAAMTLVFLYLGASSFWRARRK